ncbi:MAG TPA: ankyrin repeat domain-containing protein [Candidatus Mcinerneyibacteriales bacterium]|nr:ankyrin repeat domain-containing protein [Candidatus Mcinerneyibacteriales bacterium]HPQ89353.1 ankyrin repeat domain-containing protein [Candidatus Mcinerneyibacteriales bacterium]
MIKRIFAIILTFCLAIACARQAKNIFVLASEGSVPEMEELLKNGVDVNASDSRSLSLLHLASAFHSDPDMATLLLRYRADVEARDREGNTPLHLAARFNGNPETITRLIKGGAHVNAKNSWGATPLILAAWENQNGEVLEKLLDYGADPSVSDKNGETALDFIRENKALRETYLIRRLQVSGEREGR